MRSLRGAVFLLLIGCLSRNDALIITASRDLACPRDQVKIEDAPENALGRNVACRANGREEYYSWQRDESKWITAARKYQLEFVCYHSRGDEGLCD